MTSRPEIRNRLISLIHEIAGIPPNEVTDEARIDTELAMESVAFVELQVAIEDEFDIRLDPVQIIELNRFGAIVEHIHQAAESAG